MADKTPQGGAVFPGPLQPEVSPGSPAMWYPTPGSQTENMTVAR